MKRLLPALALCLLAPAASSQEPSAKDLRALLHADVKAYANDGHLVASWSLRKPEQLRGFTNQAPAKIRIVEGEGLELGADRSGRAMLLLKELELQQPCTISFDVKPADADASMTMFIAEPSHPGTRVVAVLNTPSGQGPDRFDYIGRMENGQPAGRPHSDRSAAVPNQWTPVKIEFKNNRAALIVAHIERGALDVDFKQFTPVFGAVSGKVMVRNLVIDTQVNRDSMRKLFRSVMASAASRPRSAETALINATAWAKIAEEIGMLELNDAQSAEIQSLPPEAQSAVDAGLASISKNEPREALTSFEKAIGIAPQSSVVLWLAGVAASDDDQHEKAAAYLETSVTRNPKQAKAWATLGEVRAERDEDDLALKAFAQAETLDPTDPWVNINRAHLSLQRARLPDARTDVARALEKRPESEGLKLLAKTLDRLSARPDWKDSFKKENAWYVVETTISSKFAADLAQRLVVYRRFLEKAFPIPIKPGAPPSRVWVFDSEEEYQVFASSIGNRHENTLGLYNMMLKTLLLTSKVSADTTQHILFHEGFHQYLDLAVPRPPIWLNEGLAEYFGATTFDVSGRATEGCMVGMRLPALRGRLPSIKKLMLMKPGTFMHPAGVGANYAASWALVHFFKQGGDAVYAKMFQAYCDAVIAGKSQAEAFAFAFERPDLPSIDTIETAFRAYVKQKLLR